MQLIINKLLESEFNGIRKIAHVLYEIEDGQATTEQLEKIGNLLLDVEENELGKKLSDLYNEGYEDGKSDGYDEGYSEGYDNSCEDNE